MYFLKPHNILEENFKELSSTPSIFLEELVKTYILASKSNTLSNELLQSYKKPADKILINN